MYCAHCGKRNEDQMLFCGYCGKPLTTQERGAETDDAESRALYGRPETSESAPAEKSPRRDAPARQTVAEPVRRASTVVPARAASARRDAPAQRDLFEVAEDERPAARPPASMAEVIRRRQEVAREIQGQGASRSPSVRETPFEGQPTPIRRGRGTETIVPRRERPVNGDNLFMDEEAVPESESARKRTARREERAYEERLQGGFWARHIRGTVTLFLLLMVGAIIAMWAYSAAGQRVLAQLNLSRQPAAYARLGQEMASSGSREMEGYYYARALELDADNAEYAVRAANAYLASGNNTRAAEALKKLIALQPDSADAYLSLKGLYPVAATRPEEIQALLRQGYERTGDSRLAP